MKEKCAYNLCYAKQICKQALLYVYNVCFSINFPQTVFMLS